MAKPTCSSKCVGTVSRRSTDDPLKTGGMVYLSKAGVRGCGVQERATGCARVVVVVVVVVAAVVVVVVVVMVSVK